MKMKLITTHSQELIVYSKKLRTMKYKLRTKSKTFFLLFLFLSLCQQSFAVLDTKGEIERNPFLTLQEQETGFVKVKPQGQEEVQLYLQAVFISLEKRIALINGHILKEGELIENNRIISIYPEEVLLKTAAGVAMTLRLPAVVKK